MKIAFVGNSLTRHGPKPDIGWTGDWGMAASAAGRDYVNLVTDALRKAGKRVERLVQNAAEMERDPAGGWRQETGELLAFGAEILVIQLGENVAAENEEAFLARLASFIRELRESGVKKIFLTGPFWERKKLEEGYRLLAREPGVVRVDFKDLQSEAFQAIGEYAHEGVSRHPSDRGMRGIAEKILDAMQGEGISGEVRQAPFPPGEKEYEGMTVELDGKKIPCYAARVSAIPFNTVWPRHQR
ncbi:MAG: SGNH/GDSL hydrolase family protein, partial [Clostridia bacterium]|nr:SGNH/GDSL hydrolase family protein [Clostridia bacterium]